jgi:hypothetical protein
MEALSGKRSAPPAARCVRSRSRYRNCASDSETHPVSPPDETEGRAPRDVRMPERSDLRFSRRMPARRGESLASGRQRIGNHPISLDYHNRSNSSARGGASIARRRVPGEFSQHVFVRGPWLHRQMGRHVRTFAQDRPAIEAGGPPFGIVTCILDRVFYTCLWSADPHRRRRRPIRRF